MSERTLKRMVWVLGVLVLAWLVVRVVGGGRGFGPGEGGGAMATFLEGLDPGGITTVEFTGGEEGTVRLQRADTAAGSPWTVEGHPADSTQAASLLDALEGATTGGPVSLNPANHARMEVADSSARRMILDREGGGADTLLLGKAGPSYGELYARLPGQDEVYLLDADLRPHANRSSADWRSKKIAAVDTATVEAVEVTRDGSTYRVERGDSTWTVDGGPADSQAVHDLLAELVSVQAQSFPADSASAPGGDPDRTVTVLGTDGAEELVVRLWEPEEEGGTTLTGRAQGPATRQPDTPFTFASWRADRLVPEADAVRGEAEGGP